VIRKVSGLPVTPIYIASIMGADTVCAGASISLSDTTAYGAWSTSGSAATIGTDCSVTGTTTGTAVITYTAGGTYTTTTVNVISCTTGVQTVSAQNELTIYPNPASTRLTIHAATGLVGQVTITNILGQLVFSGHFNSQQAEIDVSGLPAGVYAAKVNGIDSYHSVVRKFVKE
jgi:hypothetical protein